MTRRTVRWVAILVCAALCDSFSGAAAEDVMVDTPSAGVRLAATLRLPEGKGPFPAVLLINGHGPQTRGGFKPLIDGLAAQGIASLDYDKRGCGKSSGKFDTALISDLTGDAAAMAGWLKTRKDIDQRHIGIIGTSEGSAIAPVVAANEPAVSFLVLLGALGERGEDLSLDQQDIVNRAMGVHDEMVAKARADTKALFDAVLAAKNESEALAVAKATLATAVAAKALSQEQADAVAAQVSTAAMREFLAIDPQRALATIKVPVLVATGTLDLQVPAKTNFPLIRTALKDNPDVTFVEPEGVNHVFQKAKTGTVAEWSDLGPPWSDAGAINIVAAWIAARVSDRSPHL